MLNARIDQLFELNEAHESDLSVASEVTAQRRHRRPVCRRPYFGLCAATEDKKEGTTAFLEKRAPQFHGR
jgi:hypothetical protein